MQTEATQPRTVEQVAADIDTCRNQLRARDTRTVGMGYAEPNRVSKLARYYTDCMEPRGYKMTLWNRSRGLSAVGRGRAPRPDGAGAERVSPESMPAAGTPDARAASSPRSAFARPAARRCGWWSACRRARIRTGRCDARWRHRRPRPPSARGTRAT